MIGTNGANQSWGGATVAVPPDLGISVVIPARNREATLAECIESVLAQTLPPTEVIVVDDASTDRTAAVATAYAGVRLIRLPHAGGAQAARNAGIAAATGEWIAFQDSDDVWLSRKLALQVEALARRRFDRRTMVFTDYVRREMAGGTTATIRLPEFTGDAYSSLLIRPGPLFPGMLASRDSLATIGMLDEACPSYQEWDTAIRLARVCKTVHVAEPLFEWRWHHAEAISKNTIRRFEGFRYVIGKHRTEIVKRHGRAAWAALEASNLAGALRDRLYDEILRDYASPTGGGAHQIARILARIRLCPRGVGTLLRLASALSTWKHK